MKKQLVILALAATCAACGNKTAGTGPAPADSTETAAADSSKHTPEYITTRLNAIYALMDDQKCCSERYLKLYEAADMASRRDGTVFVDADHWVMGNDAPEDWSYDVISVEDITDSTARASIVIHSFDDQNVTLDLVFERNDWYVDNFHTFYEGADYDSGGNKIPGTEGIREYDEVKSIQEYLNQEPLSVDVDVDDPSQLSVPLRNSVQEAEQMTEQAKKRLEQKDEEPE